MTWPFQSDEARVKALSEKIIKEDAEQLAADIAAFMATPGGRRLFMRWIILGGGIFRISRTGDDRAYVDGRRDQALEIMNAVNEVAAKAVLQAMNENAALKQSRENDMHFARGLDNVEKKGK
jgi:hypothetical protein